MLRVFSGCEVKYLVSRVGGRAAEGEAEGLGLQSWPCPGQQALVWQGAGHPLLGLSLTGEAGLKPVPPSQLNNLGFWSCFSSPLFLLEGQQSALQDLAASDSEQKCS